MKFTCFSWLNRLFGISRYILEWYFLFKHQVPIDVVQESKR
jgi:hypothetical protein